MVISRSPSATRFATLSGCGKRGLPSCDAPKHRTDPHAETRQVAFADHVACHDFPRREKVGTRSPVLKLHFGFLIHADAKIGESDSRTERIPVKRRLVDGLRPVRLRWREARSAAIVQDLVIESARLHSSIELPYRGFELLRRQIQRTGQFRDAIGGSRPKKPE